MILTEEIKPIYLGYEESTKTYYFYFIKNGAPRFLVFVAYFFWGKGPQTALSLSPLPEGVEEELSQFLSGNLDYEFVKKRKNSKELSARKIYRTPQQVTNNVNSTDGKDLEVGNSNGGRAVGRSSRPERVEARTTAVPAVLKARRKRRTKAEMQELKKLQRPIAVVEVAVVPKATEDVKPRRKYTRRSKP